MIDRAEVTGIILAGGEGRRLGGVEKPFELVGGIPLIARVRRRLAPQVSEIVIAANRRLGEYAAWGDAVVPDEVAGVGPLGGLLAGLQVTATPWACCCPGDAPLLPESLVARLARAAEASDAEVLVPHDGTRLQPLFVLLRTELRDALRRYLAEGGRSAQGWVESRRSQLVDFAADAECFANANTREELQRLDHVLSPAGAIP